MEIEGFEPLANTGPSVLILNLENELFVLQKCDNGPAILHACIGCHNKCAYQQ